MRLLNITANYLSEDKTDIAGIFIHRQWTMLSKLGWDIRVINPQPFLYRFIKQQGKYYPNQSIRDGINIYRPRFIKLGKVDTSCLAQHTYARAIQRTVTQFTNWNPDIIICDWLVPGMPVALNLAYNLNIPAILRARGVDVRQLLRSNEKQDTLDSSYGSVATDPCLVICNGAELKKDVASLNLFSPSILLNQPNGLDTVVFRPPTAEERRLARHKFNIPQDATVIIFVGRWEQAKGSEILTNILPKFNQADSDIFFTIVGPIIDTESAEHLANQENIHFFGSMEPDKIAEILKACNIFVLPSFYEGTPNSLLEAMATGLSCIVTPVGGIKAFATHEENMLLVEPGDSNSLLLALQQVSNNKILQGKLGQAARQTIVHNGYDLDSVISELDQLFRNCIEARGN